MAIVRLYQGEDGSSHFEDIEPELEPLEGGWPQDARAVIHGGILPEFPRDTLTWIPLDWECCCSSC